MTTQTSQRNVALALGALALLALVVGFVALQSWAMQRTGDTQMNGAAVAQADESPCDPDGDDRCRMFEAAGVLDAYWQAQLGEHQSPGLVVFRQATDSPCGVASAATGPFYCPADQTIYLDGNFLATLREDYPTGQLAQMYVLAHEWGHFLAGPSDVAELRADCYAGAWIAEASTGPDRYLLPVTDRRLQAARKAAASAGTAFTQSELGVTPESFALSGERQHWLEQGRTQGPGVCDFTGAD
ncbi:neutral zinc metallopeptidase [Scrofimicrobium sp. R131]|uniref:Neutral zinc metallopeptidase n=1 Tax=Scrofimicrobium appendicitidis TaxID=3079930 RepID=A0AAU7V5U5_9ACTO